jgi:hypothetical protein
MPEGRELDSAHISLRGIDYKRAFENAPAQVTLSVIHGLPRAQGGQTALMHAASQDNIEAVRQLVHFGARVRQRSSVSKESAAMHAKRDTLLHRMV